MNDINPSVSEVVQDSKKKKPVEVRRISFNGLMRAQDVQVVTALSRVSIWRMERLGRFPARVQVSPSRVAWRGPEIRAWIDSRPRVDLKPCELEEEVATV